MVAELNVLRVIGACTAHRLLGWSKAIEWWDVPSDLRPALTNGSNIATARPKGSE